MVHAPAACCTVIALLPGHSCRQDFCSQVAWCCLQETAQADAIAGRPIVMAIVLASVTGLAYLLGLTYCIGVSHDHLCQCAHVTAPFLSWQLRTLQDYDYVLSLDNETGGLLPVGQVRMRSVEIC